MYYKIEEIAIKHKTTRASVENRLYRCRLKIKEYMKGDVDMKDKDIYDLIENIEELDKLSFDYEHLIKSVKRTNSDGEEVYNMELDYPDNKKSFIKIRSLNIDRTLSPWTLFRSDMTGSSQSSSRKDNICREAAIYVSKNNKKRRSVSFEISGGSYLIEGKWKLNID